MVDFTQTPGVLNIEATQGDDFSVLVDFDISLTGNTFEAKVDESNGDQTTITVTNTDLSEGQITLSISDTLMGALALDVHKWYLDQTTDGSQRRYLAGDFKVKEH